MLYRKALNINSDSTIAYVGLGNALAKQNRLLEAIGVYRSVLYPSPNQVNTAQTDPDTLMRYAILLARIHQWPEAVQVYEKALPTTSPASYSNLPMIDTHFSPKRSQTSLLMARAYLGLGHTQLLRSDDVGAADSFAQAVRLQPNLAITHFFAAQRPGPKTTRKAYR